MTILHGSWVIGAQGEKFYLWGERWRAGAETITAISADVAPYPYGLGLAELETALASIAPGLGGAITPKSTHLALPTVITETHLIPSSSQFLHGDPQAKTACPDVLIPWQLTGGEIPLGPLLAWFTHLPAMAPGPITIGDDLRFWSHITRWGLDLVGRGKFVPVHRPGADPEQIEVFWLPLLDSVTDRHRLDLFATQMPQSLRFYVEPHPDHSPEIPIPPSPPDLITSYLQGLINYLVGQVPKLMPEMGRPGFRKQAANAPQQWLQALLTPYSPLPKSPDSHQWLETLDQWLAPIAPTVTGQHRWQVYFQLVPPPTELASWSLTFGLQSADQPDWRISAAEIWQQPADAISYQNQIIQRPQETLLTGLGLAVRLYPDLETSLKTARPLGQELNSAQVYTFLKIGAARLEDSGFGLVMPPGLERHRQTPVPRLGLKITAAIPKEDHQGLGLASLLDFRWDLSLGNRAMTQAEFDRLVALNSPVVEVDGEWVELRPQDIQAAQAFFATRKATTGLTLQDVLRIATGESVTLEKLPVVGLDADENLKALLDALTGKQSLEPISNPPGFEGELRPYQARGVSWLTFLERWRLGACLADDMGLGKCFIGDIFVNGNLQPIQQVWEDYAGVTEFDGEGYWTTPTTPLIVNSIEETTGKIVTAPVQKLYRQEVKEKLRQVRLADGSEILITYRHKLLTHRGWTNQLTVGDYVCVPSHLVWPGKPIDLDLVKFLAWQIAEGYEILESASLRITQKNIAVLTDLQDTITRIAQRYQLRINHPTIKQFSDQVPDLRINSRNYQQFLSEKGYVWGQRSAHKAIPEFIMTGDSACLKTFLSHYFEAEGSVIQTMRSVEIATASPVIIKQLATLLRRFGIWLRVTPKQKSATNGKNIQRTYYIGTIGGVGLRRFQQEIGFISEIKQGKLKKIADITCNTNIEGIPASDVVRNMVEQTRLPLRHLGMHSPVYINGTQKFSHQSLQRVISHCDLVLSGQSEINYRQLKPSKWTTQTLQAYETLEREKLNEFRDTLVHLNTQEVFYCPIVSIEDIDYSGWVYDVQVVKHHNFIANNILCHNTIQLLAFLLHLKNQKNPIAPTLLVCPTSVLGNWEREIKKFAPQLQAWVHHGSERSKGKAFQKIVKKHDIILTSYALIYRDLDSLKPIKWQNVVLDEAQNIKNSETRQSKAVRELQTSFRIALTGTPLENRLTELWSILDFLHPGYLGNKPYFQKRYAIPIERYGDTTSLEALKTYVQPFILRRLKTDQSIIQDLPDKLEMTVFCSLSLEQASLYEGVVKKSLQDIENSSGIERRGHILATLTKLKQICNHPAQYLKEKTLAASRSGKLMRLIEMLQELIDAGDRALLFTQYAEMGKLLQAYLQTQTGREVFFLSGSTPKPKREAMVDQFQQDPQAPPIFILSLKAGGVGLNLTRANHVFHFDRWWNPAVENQATDRAFRIGQTRNVQVHKFVCAGTLEEKIHEQIERKKALAEQVVGAGEQWLTELDTEHLRDLLLLDRNAIMDSESL
ncbi:SNF2-related protein [Thermosynechococcaceae cyanobacterium BACA0444]|uniref:SNF2-related protein n=1 Tax=Pseudocalidococcus azoricus BACA0444 TaxID=2918990 RepID=A0AAE4FR33_9CYAN|nr:SNF2-related protein [Pseudocalidococcus azoricus]MDS3859987.1 SNF2-related protein [Pseudocalidococcus azoricus BACA0444]